MEPQGAAPAPAPTELKVGDALGYGFEATKRHLGPLVAVALILMVLPSAVGNVGALLGNEGVAFVAQIVSLLVGALLLMGVIRVVLAVTAGEEPEVATLFQADRYWPFLGAYLLFGLCVSAGLVLFIVPGIILAIMFGFFGYVIVQDADAGVIDALKRSSEIAKGHWGPLFLLGLAAFGINLLGLMLCLVGVLFTYPITAVAYAYAYRTLAGQPVAPIPTGEG